ncbi:hypothetical protein ABZP36_035217 [Zizania latifolia]
MRLSHYESYYGPPLCYIPCFPKSKDAGSNVVSVAPCLATDEDKSPPVQKIEEEAVTKKDDDDRRRRRRRTATARRRQWRQQRFRRLH